MPEMMARQVLAVGAPVFFLVVAMTLSMRGVCLSDAEFAEGEADVVLDGASVGVQGCGGASAVGDLFLELRLPEVEEMGQLVHRRGVAGLAGLGAVLKLLEQRLSGCRLGLGVGGHRADMAIVVAEPGLRLVLRRAALVIGSYDPGRDFSPGPDRQRWSRHLKPPT